MASRSSTSKRAPSTPAVPTVKPKCRFHPTAVVADKAQLTGSHTIELGENVIIHPYAKLKAEHSSIAIGKNSTVSETAVIGLDEGSEGDIVIGANVNIEGGAVVMAKSVGDGCVVEVRAVIGKGGVIGRHCKITPLQEVRAGEVLPDFTVVFGNGQRRVDKTLKENDEIRHMQNVGQEKKVELLKKLIPSTASKWL